MAAPAVQSLQDIIGQITAAQAPEQQQINSNITQNEQSGNAQVAGLNAAKTQAFGGIEQNAVNKGMYFSGFSPNAEATYTGSTYLPALARLQSTIAGVRQTLMGQKASLSTQANTQALSMRQGQQSELNAYQLEQQREAQALQLQREHDNFAASQNALDRAAAASNAAASRASSAPAITGYGVSDVANGGGMKFHGPNGQPISPGAYLDAISGGNAGTQDLAKLLAGSNSANDKKIASTLGLMTTSQAQKAYPWLFQ